MQGPKKMGKDHVGALLLLALGASVVAMGLGYQMGSLTSMGAGFVPVVLGVLMMLVGVAIAITAAPAGSEHAAHPQRGPDPPRRVAWRGYLCIVGGVASFVALGEHGGLLPATFAAVFVSAMGDKNNTVRSSLLLAAVLTMFCLLVFHYGLSLQLPLFQWK